MNDLCVWLDNLNDLNIMYLKILIIFADGSTCVVIEGKKIDAVFN